MFETARRILPQDTLFSGRDIQASRESPFAVEAVGHPDRRAEFRWVVEHLQDDRRVHGCAFGDYVVLHRNREHGSLLETALISAVLMSLCASAKRHALNPWAHLTDPLDQLAAKPADVTSLLPDAWAKRHLPASP